MNIGHRLLFVLALAYWSPAESATPPFQLRPVETSIEIAEAAVQSIDAGALNLDYKEGRGIDNAKAICTKEIALVRRNFATMQKRHTLYAAISLALLLKEFQSNVAHLSSLLIEAHYTTSESQAKAFTWADALDRAYEKVNSAELQYENALLNYADRIDNASRK